MIALKQILVATDFSEPSEVAVNYGRDLARSYDATLHVIHVIENMPAFYGPEVGFALADVERNIEAAVRRDLDATIGTSTATRRRSARSSRADPTWRTPSPSTPRPMPSI